ncbi:unnamed protein product, partial [Musa hybrid cultivar]
VQRGALKSLRCFPNPLLKCIAAWLLSTSHFFSSRGHNMTRVTCGGAAADQVCIGDGAEHDDDD